jgi:hypothetical protein
VLLSDRNGVFSLEATMAVEHLHVAVDAFLKFLGVMLGTRKERL